MLLFAFLTQNGLNTILLTGVTAVVNYIHPDTTYQNNNCQDK